MTLQRCLFQMTKNYISKACILPSINRQTYCSLRHQHTSRKFNDRHEWVLVDGNIGTIGISNYAQESLGDVVFAQLPDVGQKLEAGENCGALESVKAASEIYSPVSGTVTEKNTEVEGKPALINKSCYDKGWLFKLELSNKDELQSLMNEEQYDMFLKTDDAQKEKD